jgi:K+-sensing histidine kinase KdpD
MRDRRRALVDKSIASYGLAVVFVASAILLRLSMVRLLGADLPPFISFYPATVLAAVYGGRGSGLLATALSALSAVYLMMPSVGTLAIARTSDLVALIFFVAMGVFISLVVERYRHRERLMAEDSQRQALQRSEDRVLAESQYRQLALDAAGLGINPRSHARAARPQGLKR